LKKEQSLALVLLSIRFAIGFWHSKRAPVLKKLQFEQEWSGDPHDEHVASAETLSASGVAAARARGRRPDSRDDGTCGHSWLTPSPNAIQMRDGWAAPHSILCSIFAPAPT
jgi:hypothetical protein